MSSLIAQYFLNHRLDPAEIKWQMEELAKAGYQGVYAHARQGLLTPYLSNAWWRAIDVIMEVCQRKGMEFWIWDEDYFPSGLAGGRVVWENPGLISHGLEFTITEVEGKGPFEVDFAPGFLLRAFALPKQGDGTYGEILDVMPFCGTRRQHWTPRQLQHTLYSPHISAIGHPHWRCTMEENRFALSWKPPRAGEYVIVGVLVNRTGGVHPDIMRPEAVKRFIEMSHEPYLKRYGAEFGKVVKGAFTDEPSPGGALFPWTEAFPQEFHSDHSYDLLPNLAHLAVDINKQSVVIRHHYRLTQHRLLKENYVGQIARWCEEHNIAATGHLSRTEWLSLVAAWWPNELRCYQPMHIPCTDPISASCGWKETASYHTGIKVASSAAHLFSRPQAGSDALACVGDEASLRDLKYLLDYQMVLGINHFSIHGLHYSIDGPRKDEVPPSLFYQHTEWKYMSALLRHVRQTCERLTGGKHLCELAVLYPSTSLACQLRSDSDCYRLSDENLIHGLVEKLLSHQRDFDFIDEVTLQESVNDAGKITTPESYQVILLPYLRYLDEATAQALLRFARAGGKVIAIGSMPKALTHNLSAPQRSWADKSITLLTTLKESVLKTMPGMEVNGRGARDVFVLRRSKNNTLYTFIFNRHQEEFTGTVGDISVKVPPRGSLMLSNSSDDNSESSPRLVTTSSEEVADWSNKWTVDFESNHLPLNFWHVSNAQEMLTYDEIFSGPGFDLMAREPDPADKSNESLRYSCRFTLTGQVTDMHLVMEASTIGGKWKVFVNGKRVKNWRQTRIFDCLNVQANIGDALRTGSTPTLNVITVESEGPGAGLKEVPYLYGSFTCEYRYGHLSYPFVQGSSGSLTISSLQPWGVLGYPTFSGSVVYQRRVKIPPGNNLILNLGRVEDLAVVSIDGQQIVVLAWPPYRCSLSDITPGEHELAIEVVNAPANRNRAANLPAGLLGPVRLIREQTR